MKNFNPFIIAFCAVTLFATSCKKDSVVTPVKTLNLSLSTVMINQPVTVSSASDSTIYTPISVTPSGSNTTALSGHKSILSFSKAGTYIIQGTQPGSLPTSLTVTSQTYSTTSTSAALTGDQIILTPHAIDSGGVFNLYFTATTVNSYAANNGAIIATQTLNQGVYATSFTNVLIPANYTGTSVAGPVASNFTILTSLVAGTYPVSFQLNGTTYTGVAVLTTKGVTYTWNYTSGVTMSPKQLTF